MIDLDKLDALHAAATPGEMTFGVRADETAWYSIGDPCDGPHVQGDIYIDRANLHCIAATYNAYPAISKELRALLVQNGNLRIELELALLALGKREPEPETYTIGGSSE
jgi:hypothetical protein